MNHICLWCAGHGVYPNGFYCFFCAGAGGYHIMDDPPANAIAERIYAEIRDQEETRKIERAR